MSTAAAAAVAVVAAPAPTRRKIIINTVTHTTKAPKAPPAPIVLQHLTSHLLRSKISTSTKKVALLDYSVCSGRTSR